MTDNQADRIREWLCDFRRRCEESGIDITDLMWRAGYNDEEIQMILSGRQVMRVDRVLLESELVSYGTPPAPDEEWIGEDTPERDGIPEPDSPLICNGDKIDCPYLRRVDGKLGYCPLPRCVMEWGE